MKYISFIFLLVAGFEPANGQTNTTYLFIGSYTDSKPAKGIYVYKMNALTGELTQISTGENITNPSFLTISPNGKYLYACTDTKTLVAGSISSFAIDSITGKINFINKQSSTGANPVYLAVDYTNKFVVAGNYTEGNVVVFSTGKDGSLHPALQSIQFEGSGINKNRQEKPHIHSTIFSPRYDYLYLPDLGSDKIRAFKFDPGNAAPLMAVDSLTVNTLPGSGPRHMIFHPNKKFAYCIEEMSGMVVVYSYNNGKLIKVQDINSNSKKVDEYSSADIHISPDGFFLYASNRVENTISIFSIGENGWIKLIGHESTLGEVPRNFTIDPTGNFILVANQGTNNIVVFKRNLKTGLLKTTGWQISVPAPSCLQMRIYRTSEK
ncbi:MAG: lactonase family protein [Chitinophagaceae bacterium]